MSDPDELAASQAAYLTAAAGERASALRRLVKALGVAVADGRLEACAAILSGCVSPTLDYTAVQSLAGVHRKLRARLAGRSDAGPGDARRPRIAVVGSFTTTQLTRFIELALFAAGVDAETYEADYGTFRQEIIDPNSGLYAFGPQFLFVAIGFRDLAHAPELGASAHERDAAVAREVESLAALWNTAHRRLGCQIIQNNFDAPPWRTLGNHELRDPAGLGGYIARVDLALADAAPPFVTIHDVAHVASLVGGRAWGDERFFHVGKLPCPPECLFDYAHSVASVIGAHLGRAKKCLVLDLDNTLWGGVIGDDGLQGIRIGQGDAEAEAFSTFQRYVLGLKQRGILLAVCSKNDDHNARAPFEKHPDMLLGLDDIACFVANWNDKASNIREIAQRLNIGLDSLVLVDDNPAERAIVRRYLPEVAVVEMPEDPSEYVLALDAERHFQVVSLGSEDLSRTNMVRSNAARATALSGSIDMDEFLQSLKMTARVGPIRDTTLERSVQLINKTNQFNLTTRRYSTADIMAKRADDSWLDLTVSLSDCFGDNGLISVLLARVAGDVLSIDTWLMSCRVLKRGVEDMLLNFLVDLARQRGLERIVGEFRPTPRNGLVGGHYRRLGFHEIECDEEGNSLWQLCIAADVDPRSHFIEITESASNAVG